MKRYLAIALLAHSAAGAFDFDPDIIIEANNPAAPSSVTFAGTWTDEQSPNLTNAFRGNSKVASNAGSSVTATFATRLPRSGPYSVFVWHNGGSSSFYNNHNAQITHFALLS